MEHDFSIQKIGGKVCRQCGKVKMPHNEDEPCTPRREFTISFEIAACKDCDIADVWCDYHTRKMVRLGLSEQ